MRIDFAITELYPGGAERCLTEVAIGLAGTGEFVRVFSLASLPPAGPQRALVDRLENAGVPVASGGADRPLQFLKARKLMRRWLEESKPDVFQSFLYHANVLGTSVAGNVGVNVRVGGLRVAEAKRVRCWIEGRAIAQMDSLVCVSEAVKEFALNKLACHPSRVKVIGNAVDVTKFSTAKPVVWDEIGWPVDSIVTLFVGRLHPQKGIDLLREQIDKIAPAETSKRLLIVGAGPLEEQLQAWSKEVGDDRVKVLPWQSEIAPLMKAARVLVLPSLYEGMPNVVLEAMACGTPVVCSRVEGSKELLAHDDGQQGFDVGDGGKMAELVNAFLADQHFSEQTGQQNQARVRNEFSIPTMIDAYRSLYRSLVSRTDQ